MNPKYAVIPVEVIANAVAWLELLGYDLHTEHTRDTPARLSWYVASVLKKGEADIFVASFENKDPVVRDMVIVPHIPIWSACSHHLLPFFGYVDFGYIPGERILGLSKIPELIQSIAKGAWMQEHLAHAIADKFFEELGAEGVMVRICCTHTCMMLDLDRADVPAMVTSALRGSFEDCPECVEEFMAHLEAR